MSGFWELLVLDPGPSGPGASWTRGVVGGYPCILVLRLLLLMCPKNVSTATLCCRFVLLLLCFILYVKLCCHLAGVIKNDADDEKVRTTPYRRPISHS